MIKGYYYGEGNSTRLDAELSFTSEQFQLLLPELPIETGDAGDLRISDRVGQIPRKISFPDGSVFETADNDAVDDWLKNSSHRAAKMNLLHKLESSKRLVVLAVLIVSLTTFTGIKWGLPWVSEQLAFAMPEPVTKRISQETLNALDKTLFEPSELSAERQLEIFDHFIEKVIPLYDRDATYTLHFRSMHHPANKELAIPNAFALPSGDIVLTDELVKRAKSLEELDAVLLHEIGHVAYKHGLRQVIRSSIVTISLLMLTGDTTGFEEILIGLPVFLMQAHYSRAFEVEADQFAFEKMKAANIDLKNFVEIMKRITDDADGSSAKGVSRGYLSSHPPTPERLQMAEEYAEMP